MTDAVNSYELLQIIEEMSFMKIFKCEVEVIDTVGLEGHRGGTVLLLEIAKELGEIEVPPARSQMLIAYAGIVMEMQMGKPGEQGRQPCLPGCFTEGEQMSHVEAEAGMGGVEAAQYIQMHGG